MTFLPIVERELRVRARLKSTYRFRLFAAVGAILLVGFLLLAAESSSSPGSVGEFMFTVMAWVSFLYCLSDGARNTADCLSEEKRAGTLGLLFLTDLRGYDVVLGKLMATSLNSFYGLLAIFPPLAIPLVIGGVMAGEFWRLVLVLINTLFFSLTAGLLMSAASRDERRAWGGTVGVVVLLAGVPPLLLFAAAGSGSFFATLSPTTAFLSLFDSSYSAAPDRYWASVRNLNLLSWGFLAAASFVLPRAWQDRPLRSGGGARKLPLGFREEENPQGHEKRQRLLDANPVVWLVARGQPRRVMLWLFVALSGGVAVAGWLVLWGTPATTFLFFAMLVPFLILAMWVASEACHQFAGSRDSGALELLLCTPLSAKQIARGHVLGLRQIFLRPVATLLGIHAALLAVHLSLLAIDDKSLGDVILPFCLIGFQLIISVMDLYAVAHFGIWMGLSQKKPARAVTKTVLYVLLLPMLGMCTAFLWPLLAVAKDLMFINYAQEQMRRKFRFIVTERQGLVEEPEIVGRPSARARRYQLPRVLNR